MVLAEQEQKDRFWNSIGYNISAGATTGTTSFTPTDDSIYDATSNETAGISVSAVSGGGASENGTQAVTITITDNESHQH